MQCTPEQHLVITVPVDVLQPSGTKPATALILQSYTNCLQFFVLNDIKYIYIYIFLSTARQRPQNMDGHIENMPIYLKDMFYIV